jgi:Ca2+-binding EF-hand superfamily protein
MSAASKENAARRELLNRSLPLQELRKLDPVEAIRQALILRCGDLKKAYDHMDLNRNGTLLIHEFQVGLASLRIDHLAVTGINLTTLFQKFDSDGNGTISLEELLGFIYTHSSDSTKRDTLSMWTSYFNKASASKSVLARSAKWGNADAMCDAEETLNQVEEEKKWSRHRNDLKRHLHESLPPGLSKRDLVGDPKMRSCHSVSDVRRVQKEEDEVRRVQLQKIQSGLRDCSRARRDLVDMQKQIRSVDKTRTRKRASVVARQKGAELLSEIGGDFAAEFIQVSKGAPTGDELLHFNDIEISEEEKFVRQVAHECHVSVIDADEVYKSFKKVDADRSGVVDKEEFATLVKDLHKGVEVTQRHIEDWWRIVDEDKSGSISFAEFLVWWCGRGDDDA